MRYFTKVEDAHWKSDKYTRYLNANPFYTNMFNEHQKTKADTITYNKESLTRALLKRLKSAQNPSNPKRAKDYFLAANCYFNMTHQGNSWIMKRYFWTANITPTKLESDPDYFNCDLAKRYYLKAAAVSKNKKFAALSLRMAARCESYNLAGKVSWKERFDANKYYKQIKTQYPDYYDNLVTKCGSFDRYFESYFEGG